MKDGRTYFVINDGYTIDERVVAFTRQGNPDYIFFINRSADEVKISDVSQKLFRFRNFKQYNGSYDNDCVTLPPYDYAIVEAEFVG